MLKSTNFTQNNFIININKNGENNKVIKKKKNRSINVSFLYKVHILLLSFFYKNIIVT